MPESVLFNSIPFLIFLPMFMTAYWLTRGRVRWFVMLVGSAVFYGWWDWRFLFLLLFSSVVDYTLGILIENENRDWIRHRLIVLSVSVNLGLLGFFKYFNFFIDSAVRLVHSLGLPVAFTALRIVLPVGISFYVFKTMSYTIDVYRRTQKAERSLLKFTTFVIFFPELVAGPIVRASRMLPQMDRDHDFRFDRMLNGTAMIASGYVRKVVIADSIAPLVDARFAAPQAHSSLSLLIGVYLYAFQIYCDFSGYSNIAIGLARIFGFDFGINFDHPYFSRSFSEFWTRWHLSLSSWLRDYLYIPLGGNRGSRAQSFRNLMITMLLGGLWHGANWTFVAWGGLHGVYLVGQRLIGPAYQRAVKIARIPAAASNVFLVLVVFHLTCFGWIFFRAPTFGRAWNIMQGIGRLAGHNVPQAFLVLKALVLIAGLVVADLVVFLGLQPKWAMPPVSDGTGKALTGQLHPAARLAFTAACCWLILVFGTFSGNTFIYFQF